MKRIIGFILAAALCLGALAACGSGGKGKTGGSEGGDKPWSAFDIDFNTGAVEKFMKAVCRNIDAESAAVVSVEPDGAAISATLKIKLEGLDAHTLSLTFSNRKSDKVKMVQLTGYHSSEEVYACGRAIALGMDKTLGSSRIGKTLKPYGELDITETARDAYWISGTVRASTYVSFEDSEVLYGYIMDRDDKPDAGSMASALTGSWSRTVGTDTDSYVFSSDGSGKYGYNSAHFEYRIDSDNTLTVNASGVISIYVYSRMAMDGEFGCWYIDGNTLYVELYAYEKD